MNAIETILSRKSIPLMEDPKPSKSQLKKIYKRSEERRVGKEV